MDFWHPARRLPGYPSLRYRLIDFGGQLSNDWRMEVPRKFDGEKQKKEKGKRRAEKKKKSAKGKLSKTSSYPEYINCFQMQRKKKKKEAETTKQTRKRVRQSLFAKSILKMISFWK